MKIKLFAILVGVLACSAVFADQNDFRCLKSIGPKSPLRLQFVLRTDKPDDGYVIYQNGSGSIPVKKLKVKELRRGPDGRPSEFETEWEEVTSDGGGGTYVVVSQGARINGFRYIRKKDGKTFKFEEDPDAVTEKGCDWKTSATDPCKDPQTTLEINECVSKQVEAAEKELAKYLEESRRRYADEPKSVEALNKAQKSWLQFRKDHCDAIYEMWSGGTIRGAMHGNCLLEQTRRRTHDLWQAYLTFMDSTPPILPEPKLDEKRK